MLGSFSLCFLQRGDSGLLLPSSFSFSRSLSPQVAEVSDVTEEDLQVCFVDTQLLENLKRALQALGINQTDGGRPSSPTRPGTANRSSLGGSPSAGSPSGRARPSSAFPVGSGAPAVRRATASANSPKKGGNAGRAEREAAAAAVPEAPKTPAQQLAMLLREHALIKLLPLVSLPLCLPLASQSLIP